MFDRRSNLLLWALEEGDSAGDTVKRIFLREDRPFTMRVFSPQGTEIFKLTRSYPYFFFDKLDVSRPNGAPLGKVERRFSILRRLYTVADHTGRQVFEIFGPLLQPWTFQIRKGRRQLGTITKKWSGLLKESFTNADNFGIRFPRGIDVSQKAVLLGAVFLIDFAHFETRGGRR